MDFMEHPSPSSSRPEGFPVGLRVLVVDDDPTWLKILEKMLRKCSYEVTTCGLARVALELIRERKHKFDIIISDVNMPDMDGFKLLEHVGLEMDLPVIMMSVDGETSRVMKGVQHGACDYLLKPIRMKELRNIWQHVYRKKIHEVKEIESHDISEEMQIIRNGFLDFDDKQISYGSDLNSPRKRKDMDNREHDDQDFSDSSAVKKARVVWSVDLHKKFVNAVDQIGFDKVGPKKILDLMNVPGLTRENVASHLQKYRLYLSRLQKQNDGRSSCKNLPLDVSSKTTPASFTHQNPILVQQQNTAARRFYCSTPKIHAQGIIPDISGDDLKSIVPLQADSKEALTSDALDCNKLNTFSQSGVVISFKGAAPNGLLEDYSLLPQPCRQHHAAVHHLHIPPSVVSKPHNVQKDRTGSSQVKPLVMDYRSSRIKNVSLADHGVVNSQYSGTAQKSSESSQIKDFCFDQTINHNLIPASKESSLKVAELAPLPEDWSLCSPQRIGCFEDVGLNSLEFFQYCDSAPETEVHSDWPNGLEFNYEYLYDSAGDMFVFPKGLVHYQVNRDVSYPAVAVSAFGSANSGTVSMPSTYAVQQQNQHRRAG